MDSCMSLPSTGGTVSPTLSTTRPRRSLITRREPGLPASSLSNASSMPSWPWSSTLVKPLDRKSTRLISTHSHISYTVLLFFNDTATTEIFPLPLHDALPNSRLARELLVERQFHAFLAMVFHVGEAA